MKKLTPQQKKWLMIGAPVVAVFALVAAMQRSKKGAASGSLPAIAGGNGTAIDAGQLASYEAGLSASLAALSADVNSQLAAFFQRAGQVANDGSQNPTPSTAPSPTVAAPTAASTYTGGGYVPSTVMASGPGTNAPGVAPTPYLVPSDATNVQPITVGGTTIGVAFDDQPMKTVYGPDGQPWVVPATAGNITFSNGGVHFT